MQEQRLSQPLCARVDTACHSSGHQHARADDVMMMMMKLRLMLMLMLINAWHLSDHLDLDDHSQSDPAHNLFNRESGSGKWVAHSMHCLAILRNKRKDIAFSTKLACFLAENYDCARFNTLNWAMGPLGN